MTDRKRLLRYVLLDLLSAAIAWQVFNILRFHAFRHTVGFDRLSDFVLQPKALILGVLIPVFWVLLYFFSGYYAEPRRKTNLGDFKNTLVNTFVGVLTLYFLVIINDYPESPFLYYEILAGFFVIHLLLTACVRFFQTNPLIEHQSKGKDGIPVLILGTGKRAQKLRKEFNRYNSSFCYQFRGFVRVDSGERAVHGDEVLGEVRDLKDLVVSQKIEELLFAMDDLQSEKARACMDFVYPLRLPVRAYSDRRDVLAGKVTLFSLFGIPLYNLLPVPMSVWQQNMKVVADKVVALLVLILASPLFAYLALRVRLDSPGPVFYSQERVGKGGQLFNILKFRTMLVDSEPEGPVLSSVNDARVTNYGRFMRKYRLDELPQFWNVLKGEMSLVGPRPERLHFVEQIVQKAPQFYLTQLVSPGITSWGMVKFGYADTVEKMIQRLEYDLIYLENQSLLLDFKILVYTIKPLLRGKGQ